MVWFALLHVFAPAVVGLLIALVLRGIASWRGRAVATPRRAATASLVGAGAVIVLVLGVAVVLQLPFAFEWLSGGDAHDLRQIVIFVTPLAAGIVGTLLLIVLRPRTRGAGGVAELSPRTIASFTRPAWWVALGAITAAIVVVTVLTGLASSPSAEGRYTDYTVDLGTASIGTTIYGWYYSAPSLVALVALGAVLIAGLSLIARPPLAVHRDEDIAVRRSLSRETVLAAVGALLLHLGEIFGSLAGAASIRGSFPAAGGSLEAGSPIAGFGPFFSVSAFVLASAGFALLFGLLLLALRIPARRVEALAQGAR
ncbi:hypothetical protein N8K70_15620 [Microbacterium betulae]|uniref:Uncharacterized protein n=1 Tax=Microbacterium betulae TaxID=2981139 RepID=A0AA97I6N2_9MICO|nr:hypothetical protein [Microbacterium sp. AB]WOF22802.1 hypothetical protein N8K70_15620 [Microbacterium sp. AB]